MFSNQNAINMKNYKNKITLAMLNIALALASCTTENPYGDARDNYTGNWFCQENSSQLGSSSYNVSISKSLVDSTAILIGNFYNLGGSKSAKAIVNGNSITIEPQLVDNLNVSGSGTRNGNTINLNYAVSAGGTDNVSATYSR